MLTKDKNNFLLICLNIFLWDKIYALAGFGYGWPGFGSALSVTL